MKRIIAIIGIVILLGASGAWAKTRYLTNVGDLAPHSIGIPLTEVAKGGTAPTKASLGTTPTVQGLLFDATDELYQIQFQVPDCWNEVSDITFDLYVVLYQAETAGDSIAFTADYVSVTAEADAVTKTSTNITTTELVVASCAGEGCLYKVVLTLDYDDTDNPLAKEDVVVAEIHRTNVTNVGGVLLIAVDAHFDPKL